VATQLKILIPVGMAMSMVDAAKAEFRGAPMPTAKHVVAQTSSPGSRLAIEAATTIG